MCKRLLTVFLAAVSLHAQYDILIRNARIVDGGGNPWYRGDVAIANGRIAELGFVPNATAKRTIDAGGRVAAPGFIDVHTHLESDFHTIPGAENFVLDGVTSVVTGNCGGSKLELAEWFSTLEQTGIAINVASLVGHNSVRAKVMGSADRAPTPEELTSMKALVERAMREGAVGFSTGLEYTPGTYADTEEIKQLAAVAARFGGAYASHMRNEGAEIGAAIAEAAEIANHSRMPAEISHLKIDSRLVWGSSAQALQQLEQLRAEGVDVVADQYPYDRSSTTLNLTLPKWALVGGREELIKRLSDAETRERIRQDMLLTVKGKGQPNFGYAQVSRHGDGALNGKNISEINKLQGGDGTLLSEAETILKLVEAGGAQMVYHAMGEDDVERIFRYPNTAVASDGGVQQQGPTVPHPRSYGTNARVLAEFVRNRKLTGLEEAVRRMTSLPARTFGLQERGLLRPGMAADVVLFDPAIVQDHATFQQPHQYSTGFDVVIVNGEIVAEGGKVAGARPGRPLRHALP